jgi:hypothetical protein
MGDLPMNHGDFPRKLSTNVFGRAPRPSGSTVIQAPGRWEDMQPPDPGDQEEEHSVL